jgi:5-methylcytosine-specific restriction enzyme A
MCEANNKIVAATTVDHITPHRGQAALFWDAKNWQSLCTLCHNMHKQRIEHRGYANDIDAHGYPIDAKHPFNQQQTKKFLRGG